MGDSIEYCKQCENRVGCHLERRCFRVNDKDNGPLDAAPCSAIRRKVWGAFRHPENPRLLLLKLVCGHEQTHHRDQKTIVCFKCSQNDKILPTREEVGSTETKDDE